MTRRQHISPLRSLNSFRRKAGRKPPRSVTLIVCEGEKTEPFYFKALRRHYGLSNAEIVIADHARGSAPVSVVEYAEQKAREEGGYDRIFCVFDRDEHGDFERARQRIQTLSSRKRHPLPVVETISIPCFELWILLHFERSDAGFSRCADVTRKLREHVPSYGKADSSLMTQLMEKLSAALENADWLEGRAEETGWEPYTSVHKLARHMQAEGGKKE